MDLGNGVTWIRGDTFRIDDKEYFLIEMGNPSHYLVESAPLKVDCYFRSFSDADDNVIKTLDFFLILNIIKKFNNTHKFYRTYIIRKKYYNSIK